MDLHATPLPSGAAARLVWSVTGAHDLTILATSSSTPPSGPADASARVVIKPGVPRLDAPPVNRLEHGSTRYEQTLDLHVSLADTPITYHLYRDNALVASRTVDAREPYSTADVHAIRDTVRQRMEYHLARMVTAGLIHPQAGYVPVLERETLERDEPYPAALLKESLTPSGEEGIGKARGEDERHLYRSYKYRCRIDLLILSRNPAERTDLANRLHESFLVDSPLYEAAGWRGLTINRFMRSGDTSQGDTIFGEEITIDGVVEFVTAEEKQYHVPAADGTGHGGLMPFNTRL